MTTFTVNGMNCASCVHRVTSAVQELDPEAMVAVDLAGKTVQTDASASLEAIKSAIENAGYEAVPA
ncbi:heavy-metal-associated domain-containing protein [Erythrobacter mangrovi]|uniref:Heavy-metal-associated domain-containing protein n=1 Tax=Erythrobacter mangrovi TaxID=2739433 RepID=A0A7D3XSK3_9SPHN|nr:heavy-metal-associated domain-containing protein [Erythrobacter mangrovi]QKG72554.1 heavy-metal-associated domain-containing protein [Erythrobacter mangrovi]